MVLTWIKKRFFTPSLPTFETLLQFRNALLKLSSLLPEDLPFSVLEAKKSILLGRAPAQCIMSVTDAGKIRVNFHHFADPIYVGSFVVLLMAYLNGPLVSIGDTFLFDMSGKAVMSKDPGFKLMKAGLLQDFVETHNAVTSTLASLPIDKKDLN